MKISCIGMSHLGLVTSLSFAVKGHEVLCFDSNKSLIGDLNLGIIPIEEPDYETLFKKHKDKIKFSFDFTKIIESDLIFITKDIDTNNQGKSNYFEIKDIISKLSKLLNPKTTIIIMSQFQPGLIRALACEFNLNFVYQVETLIFGEAIRRALYPERFILGLKERCEDLPLKHKELLESFNVPILKMNYESAELAKIAINMFLAASVTTTNSLAEVCECIGADWSDIKQALKLDRRIGKDAYLNPGLGISGGNLERDVNNIIEIANQKRTHLQLFEAFMTNSEWRKEWPSRILRNSLDFKITRKKIAIWGLSYKRNTNSIKNSPSIFNIRKLFKDFEIHASDPVVERVNEFEGKIVFHKNPLDCLDNSEALLILTDWEEYRSFKSQEILKSLKNPLIIDPYGIFSHDLAVSKNYFTLGKGWESY